MTFSDATRLTIHIFGKRAAKRAPSLGRIVGEWLLYGKEHVSNTADQFRIHLWKVVPKKRKNKTRNCEGRLTIESHGYSKTFDIPSFVPPHRVSSRPLSMQFKQPVGTFTH
jgi:hypothetical protein